MNINKTLDEYFSFESKLKAYFDTDIYEAVGDYRHVEWNYEEGGDVSWIEDDEFYMTEVYGTSVWKGPELTMFTVYSDFGGKYHAIFSNDKFNEDLEE
jgi:hypothetical protein